jgi:hypothetical protein
MMMREERETSEMGMNYCRCQSSDVAPVKLTVYEVTSCCRQNRGSRNHRSMSVFIMPSKAYGATAIYAFNFSEKEEE